MSNPNRRRCPRCFYASDTETTCPAICCRGTEMEPAPDALLDGETFAAESWDAQVEAERLTNVVHPERFVRPLHGFRSESPASALHSLHQGDEAPLELDRERASALREWEDA